MGKKRRNIPSENVEEMMLYALQEKGFTGIERVEKGVDNFIASRKGQRYRILFVISSSSKKYRISNGIQERFLESVGRNEEPLCCVYFTSSNRLVIKDGRSSGFQPYDRSLF